MRILEDFLKGKKLNVKNIENQVIVRIFRFDETLKPKTVNI